MTESIPEYGFVLESRVKDDRRFLPTKGEPAATGYDVRAAIESSQIVVEPFELVKIPLGFKAFCPAGWWLELRPRSSSFAKKNIHCLYGIVDEQYENQLFFVGQYIPPAPFSRYRKCEMRDGKDWESNTLTISFGDALGQIVPIKRQEMAVKELLDDQYKEMCARRGGQRGLGGFGSTNK